MGPTPHSKPLTLSPASIFQSNKRPVAPKRKKDKIFDLIGESITCSKGFDDGLFRRAIVQLAARVSSFRIDEGSDDGHVFLSKAAVMMSSSVP
jgi:hypothetical protein